MPVWLVAAMLATAATLYAQSPKDLEEAREDLQNGDRRLAEGRYQNAFRDYTSAVEAGDAPTRTAARKGRIRSALRLAQFVLATRDAELLRSEAPDDVDAATLYADALWSRGLFDEAEVAYRAAADRYPTAARAHFGLARSFATWGQLDAALAEAIAARAAAPSDAELVSFVAYVYERLLRYDEAARTYEATLPLLPRRLSEATDLARSKIKLLRGFTGREPVAIDEAARAMPHVVPFTLIDRKIVFEARINGKKVALVLDTGSERTALSRRTAASVGLQTLGEILSTGVGAPGLGKHGLARADSLEIGTLRVANVPVSVTDVSRELPPWQAESFSPMSIGLSVIVDYARLRLTFARQLPREAADFTLPMRVYRLPLVRGRLNTRHAASFVVDTGGEMMSISSDVAGQIGPLPARRIALRVLGVNGIDRDAFLLPGVDMGFSALEYPSFSVAVLNLRAPSVLLGFQLGGILGYKFLHPYRVVMDFGRGELRLQKSAS